MLSRFVTRQAAQVSSGERDCQHDERSRQRRGKLRQRVLRGDRGRRRNHGVSFAAPRRKRCSRERPLPDIHMQSAQLFMVISQNHFLTLLQESGLVQEPIVCETTPCNDGAARVAVPGTCCPQCGTFI